MKKIVIIPNDGKDIGLGNTVKVVQSLSGRADIYMDEEYAVIGHGVNFIPRNELYSNRDAVIVLGGDGTILSVAAQCAKQKIPVLGINLGKVGFMTEIEINNMDDALSKLLDGDYETERRMMMRVERRSSEGLDVFHALNDVVVAKTAESQLICVELFSDEQLVNRYIADGLIIATPTGSTGYSISAGGPVVDPNMSLFVATPICAHMLSVRSAVLSDTHRIRVRLGGALSPGKGIITADGDIKGFMNSGGEIVITKSEYELELIKIGKQSFFETVLKKLS